MIVGRYRHNFEGFYENFTTPMSINKERMIETCGAYLKLVVNSLFSLGEDNIISKIRSSGNHVDIARG